MAITVLNRPLGHKLSGTELAATASDSSGEVLMTTVFTHAMTTGEYVYIQSNIAAYNGYKYVIVMSSTTFKIADSSTSDPVAYWQDGAITYQRSVLEHGWLAVSQPIVYELESDLFPLNVAEDSYTANAVLSQSNANGYTQIALSSALTDPTVLSWVKIGENVYQILTVNASWNVIINLAYDATNDLSGNVVKYYNNYCINVEVYCGFPSDHAWYDVKPYELAATLRLVPDDNNNVKFSIAEIVRSYIKTRNKLDLETLPNNTDFTCGFYIVYFESYDDSDGTTITTLEGTHTNDLDEFEGHAVNASMPFKSTSVSHMNDYMAQGSQLAKWLTLQERPLAVVGRFFDISFLLPVSPSANPGFTHDTLPDVNTWGSILIDATSAWVQFMPPPTLTLNAGHTLSYSDILTPAAVVVYEEGQTYSYRLKVTADSAGTDNVEIRMLLLSISNTVLDFFPLTSAGVSTPTVIEDTYTFVAPAGMYKFGIASFYASTSGGTVVIDEFEDETVDIPASAGGFMVDVWKNLNGGNVAFETLTFANTGIGLMRVPLTIESGYDEYCIRAYIGASPEVPGTETLQTGFPALSFWTNQASGQDWNTGIPNPDVDLVEPTTNTSKLLRSLEFAFIVGRTYRAECDFVADVVSGTSSGTGNNFRMRITDNALSPVFTATTALGAVDVSDTIEITFVADANCKRIDLYVERPGNSGYTTNTLIDDVRVYLIGEPIPAVDGQDITETICIDIIEECDDSVIPTVDDVRLTEDGDFRILE